MNGEEELLLFSCLCRVYVQRVGQLKGRVALDCVTAVEFVEESAFNLPHTFQVSQPTVVSAWCGILCALFTSEFPM